MMRLTTMVRVDSTIASNGANPIATDLLAAWRHDVGSARFFRSSVNFIYDFRRDGERHYLRFAEDSERDLAKVESELEIVSGLARAGIPVAEPVPSRRGDLVVTHETELGLFHAVVFPCVPGVHRDGDLEADDFYVWGASLGRLHAALKQQVSSREVRRPSWEDQLQHVEAQLQHDSFLRQELAAIRQSWETLPVEADAFGLIHGDFQLDNILWGDELHIIDFDDCAYHWYVADVAFALADQLPDEMNPTRPPLRQFLEGYRTETSLTDAVLSQIETFRRAGDLIRYAKIRRALDLPPATQHPRWARELSDKLHLYARAYEQRRSA